MSVFSCAHLSSIHLLWWSFFIGLFVFLLLSVKSSLYISDTSLLSNMWFANLFQTMYFQILEFPLSSFYNFSFSAKNFCLSIHFIPFISSIRFWWKKEVISHAPRVSHGASNYRGLTLAQLGCMHCTPWPDGVLIPLLCGESSVSSASKAFALLFESPQQGCSSGVGVRLR